MRFTTWSCKSSYHQNKGFLYSKGGKDNSSIVPFLDLLNAAGGFYLPLQNNELVKLLPTWHTRGFL